MYQLLTDSAVDLPYQVLADNHVDFVSMQVDINGEDFKDDLEHHFDLKHFYQQIDKGIMPSTTQINVGQFVAFFRPYVEAKMPILYLGFSSGLSGTYNSALQAKKMLLNDYPDAQIYLVDSLAACCGEGLMLLDAIDKRDAGTPIDELANWLTTNALRYRQWFTVDDLNYLYHGGRVSRTSATVGSLLHIKPVMDVDTVGHLRVVKKARSRRRSLETLAANTLATLANHENPRIIIATSDAPDAAKLVRDQLMASVPNAQILLEHIGPTIASHTGLGCVAVFSLGVTKRN
ncbi:fatty acid-binding protein DegV [Loigolactobacillus backii]|uniref:DegV family protein n=1 Tax=Loigolactobacillus backii TaxID=375175 RepID=UPI000C1C94DD|nr:DegV family protein [Loigolactobacillus backii]PIO83970.1 fatty acid-binding protein DegV [Loigolactobacillus backii]